jgi:hypothetical protein
MSTWLKGAVICAAWVASAARPTATLADDSLAGRWLLVNLSFGESNQAIFDIQSDNGVLTGEPVALPAGSKVPTVEQDGNKVTVVLEVGGSKYRFVGTRVEEGDDAGRIVGVFGREATVSPARLQKTEAEKLPRSTVNPAIVKIAAIERDADLKAGERVEKLEALLEGPATPAQQRVYLAIFKHAADADLSADRVGELMDHWLADARKYGEPWVDQCRANGIKALNGQKAYAELNLKLAQQAEQALPKDATLEQQAAVVALLASAARDAGKDDLARISAQRSARLEEALDEEYLRTVPPFEPEKFAGREKTDHNRVVLMELFTGAQCPPCVAADVGFDALLKTYRPTELVTLQYHLHIPGPDPLTNADTEARSKYYAVRGTPSTYFNGASEAYGGGGMANGKTKYDQYREVIDTRLEDTRKAEITLAVARSGDTILVTGTAQAKLPPPEKKKNDAPSKSVSDASSQKKAADTDKGEDADKAAEAKEPKLRLRLALTEEAIRYVGGNKLRFHHHVVRAMPGGAEGIEMVAGQCRVDQTIELSDVRKSLDEYLSSGKRDYPNALPEIALEDLSLVALVQDDADKSVWHAVMLPIPASK